MSAAQPTSARSGLALALLIFSIPLAGCERFASAEQRIKHAQLKLAQGDYADASLDLRELLDRSPNHPEARLALAEAELQLGDAGRAQAELAHAREGGVSAASTRELEFRILVAAAKFAELRAAAEADSSLPPGRDLAYAAVAEQALGNDETAERQLHDALALAPDDAVIAVKWVEFLAHRRRFDEAGSALGRLLEHHPDEPEAWLLQADLLVNAEHFREAREALQKALAIGNGRLSVLQETGALSGIAQTSMLLVDEPGTVAALAALRSRAPRAGTTHYLLGRYAFMRRDFFSATVELRRALQLGPANPQWRLLLAAALAGQSSFEQASVELTSLIADDPTNDAARKLLAQVYLARDKPDQARGVLEIAGKDKAQDSMSQWLLGRALVQSGSAAEGIEYLERSVAADPNNVRRLGDLAAAYIVAGQRDKALKTIARMPKEAAGPRRSALIFFTGVYGQDPVHGSAAVERLVGEHGDDSVLLALAGSYLMHSADLSRARELLLRAIAIDGSNVEARQTLATMEAEQGHLDLAEQQLRAILATAPGDQAAFLALSELALRRGDRPGARALLEQAIGSVPGAIEARLRLARMAFLDGEAGRARAWLEQVSRVAPGQASAINAEGQVLYDAGQYDDALPKFAEALDLGLAEARINAARTHLALGHPEQAEHLLRAGLAANHAWLGGAALLADIQARQGRLKEALATVAGLRLASGDQAASDELEGDVDLVAKHYADAGTAFAKAAAREPSARLAVKSHYARGLGNLEHAEQPLHDWLSANPNDNGVRRVLAQFYQSRGERAAAIGQYERIVRSELEGDAVSLNNLAWLYLETGDPRALETARRAYQIRPDTPDIADTYGWMLVQSGQPRQALPILEHTVPNARDRTEVQYHLAVAYVRCGEPVKARTLLETVLRTSDRYAWRADAEKLLKSLKS